MPHERVWPRYWNIAKKRMTNDKKWTKDNKNWGKEQSKKKEQLRNLFLIGDLLGWQKSQTNVDGSLIGQPVYHSAWGALQQGPASPNHRRGTNCPAIWYQPCSGQWIQAWNWSKWPTAWPTVHWQNVYRKSKSDWGQGNINTLICHIHVSFNDVWHTGCCPIMVEDP